MAVNETTSVDVQTLRPFKRFIMTIGLLPTSYLESMTYAELVMWFCNFLQEQVIPTVNNNAEAVIELQNWFNNLDVQDEIDNKLDEMAESGQLTDIIAQYLGLAGLITFNTVAELKTAENLVNGSKCKTLGFRSYNDGGGAFYKIRQITNDDVVDEATLIKVHDNLLIAELITNENINVKQLGAYGDNTHDDSDIFQIAINTAKTRKIDIVIPESTYLISKQLEVNSIDNIIFNCYGIIHAESTNSSRRVFSVKECSNVIFNGFNIYSERDKTEAPPADHTRVTTLGSNRAGFVLLSCENIQINNCKFNNMMYDFLLSSVDNSTKNKNIKINNYESENGSQNTFVSYVDYLEINNAKILPAADLGSGDHHLYISQYSDDVVIRNCNFNVKDGNFGGSIIMYAGTNDADVVAKRLKIYDSYIRGVCLLTCSSISSADLYNVIFDSVPQIENPTYQQCMTQSGTGYINAYNCKFNCYYMFYGLAPSATPTIQIINSEIISQTYYLLYGTGNPNITIKGCKIIQNANNGFIYNTSTAMKLLVENCDIYGTGTYSFFISNRTANANNNFVYKYNTFTFTNTVGTLIYNGSSTNSTGLKLLYNFLYNVTSLGGSAATTDLVQIANYLDDVIIT